MNDKNITDITHCWRCGRETRGTLNCNECHRAIMEGEILSYKLLAEFKKEQEKKVIGRDK